MSPSTDVRERREFASEIKFVVPSPLAEQLSDWARARLMPDPNAGGASGDTYEITSLYFDTETFDVFHRHGSFGRSKLRVRRYGQTELLFLERKLRTHGLLAKRRSIVSIGELDRLTEETLDRNWPGYWFHRRLLARGLKAVCQISYQRLARVAMTPYGPIRLTIDCDLRGVSVDGLKFTTDNGSLLLDGSSILELKFRRELPVLFKNLLQEFALNPEPISKYRQAVKILELAPAPGLPNSTPVYA
jgi:VTC domain